MAESRGEEEGEKGEMGWIAFLSPHIYEIPPRCNQGQPVNE